MFEDAQGLRLTTTSADAATAFDAAVSDYLDYRSSAFGPAQSSAHGRPRVRNGTLFPCLLLPDDGNGCGAPKGAGLARRNAAVTRCV